MKPDFVPSLVAGAIAITLLVAAILGKLDFTVALAFVGGALIPVIKRS